MSTNYTTVSFGREHKPAIEKAQEALADELGFEPTKGDTVVHLAKRYAESSDD